MRFRPFDLILLALIVPLPACMTPEQQAAEERRQQFALGDTVTSTMDPDRKMTIREWNFGSECFCVYFDDRGIARVEAFPYKCLRKVE